jgi:hypothetical protein
MLTRDIKTLSIDGINRTHAVFGILFLVEIVW